MDRNTFLSHSGAHRFPVRLYDIKNALSHEGNGSEPGIREGFMSAFADIESIQ